MRSLVPIKFLFDLLNHALSIHPVLAVVLRPHLPRPRVLRSLLDAAFFPRGPLSPIDSKPSPRGLQPPEISTHTNYENFAKLQRDVRQRTEEDSTVCERRGCKKIAEARCSLCQAVSYCGKQCQTRYVTPIIWHEEALPRLMLRCSLLGQSR